MSSKKARRRARQEQEQEQTRKGKLSPVTLFILGIGAALLITVGGAVLLVDRADRGDAPWPGAVWSEAHGHWH